MNTETTEIKKIGPEQCQNFNFLDQMVKLDNFNLKTAILLKNGKFYQYFANYDKTIKCPQKKPTKPGKAKAAKCFHETRKACMEFSGYEIVAMKMFNKQQGEFVNFSYEHCPVDVVEYLISKRS